MASHKAHPSPLQASARPSIFQSSSEYPRTHALKPSAPQLAITQTRRHPENIHTVQPRIKPDPDVSRAAINRRWNKDPVAPKSHFAAFARQSEPSSAPKLHLQQLPTVSTSHQRTSEPPLYETLGSSARVRSTNRDSPLAFSSYGPSSSPPSFLNSAYTHSNQRNEPDDQDFRLPDNSTRVADPLRNEVLARSPSVDPGVEDNVFSQITQWKEGWANERELNATLRAELLDLEERHSSQSTYINTLETERAKSASLLQSKESSIQQKDVAMQCSQNALDALNKEHEALKTIHTEAARQFQDDRKHVVVAKGKLKQRLDLLVQEYSASETVLKSLKSQQQDVHNMVGTTLREIQALKSSNSTAIASINSLLDQDSQYEHRQEIRSLVTDLQETASKSHQVNDFLRDKLQTSGLQLLEAKEKIAQLEARSEHQSEKNTNILSSVRAESKQVVHSLIEKEQDALQRLHEVTCQLRVTEGSHASALATIDERDVSIGALKAAASAEHIRTDGLKSRIEDLSTLLENAKLEGCSLQTKLGVQEEQKLEMIGRLNTLETSEREALQQNLVLRVDITNANALRLQLEAQLGEITLAAQEARQTIAAQSTRLDGLCSQNNVLAAELNQVKPRAAALEADVMRTTKEQLVVQERFETISLRLSLTEEDQVKLQDQLRTSELSVAVLSKLNEKLESDLSKRDAQSASLHGRLEKLTTMSEKYKGEISLHQMEIASLQSCVLQSQQASNNGTEKREEEHTNALLSLQARLNDSQQALGHRDAVYAKSMQVSEESAAHQAARAKIAEQLVGTLEAQVDSMKSQIALITSQLHAAHEPREAGEQHVGDGAGLRASTSEAEELNRQLSLSKAALACLQERALLLPERYETGDLTDVERNFINSLVKMSNSTHVQELAQKENELRRKDNVAGKLQMRVKELEASLARVLQEVGKDADMPSILDLSVFLPRSPDLPKESEGLVTPSTEVEVGERLPEKRVLRSGKDELKIVVHPADVMPGSPVRTFGELRRSNSEISDFEDDLPLAKKHKGKRGRASSPPTKHAEAPPARRTRTAARKNDQPAQTKTRKK